MIGSRPSRSIAGTRPTVDSVTPRADVQPVLVVEHPQRLHHVVVVVQRLAHAHEDDVEGRVEEIERARARAPAPTISPAERLRTNPILPVRQNPQSIAQPTWLEMQKVSAGVSGMKTDSMRRPSASAPLFGRTL
jgi:hypothetical protein